MSQDRSLTPEQHAALQKVIKEKREKLNAQRSVQQQSVQQRTAKQQRPVQQQQPVQTAHNRQYAQSAYRQQSEQSAVPQWSTLQQRPAHHQPAQQLRTAKQQQPVDLIERQRAIQRAAQQRSARRPAQNRYPEAYGHPGTQKKKKRSAKSAVLTILLIIILSGAGFGGWYYWWTEHATFDYRLQPVVVLDGQTVNPAEFLSPGGDMQNISAVFRSPVFRPVDGRQDVQLTLTRGWRTVEATALLYVLTTVPEIHHEFREPGQAFSPNDFIMNADVTGGFPFAVQFEEQPLMPQDYSVGAHTLKLSLNNAPFEVLLTVTDTIAPTATAVSKTIQIGEDVIPEDFVEDVFDESDIESINFVEEPDVFAHRDQIVLVEVTDIHGNSEIFSGGLTILLNQDAPVIEGIDTIVIMVGDSIMYLRDVTAFDDFGRDISDRIEVDSSGVDQLTVGEYTVIYSVEDYTGNRTEVEESVHVVEIDMEFVHEKVDEALAGIISDSMTQLEMVKAIHTWVRSNINYSQTRGGPATAYEGAYIALSQRRGNCYIFYSISEVMLTRAGVPNMRIERIEGTPTRHRWNLVNPDNLGWHHFDAYPTRLGLSTQMAFFTSSQAEEFTRRLANQEERPMRNYYTYNPELYPEIVR